jgi:maltooligosyltrehalose synthase
LTNDWQHTTMILPPGTWADEFNGDVVSGEVLLASLFQKFPAALLVRKEKD